MQQLHTHLMEVPIGPAWDLKKFWLNEGHSFGITAAGGSGWQLAEWIINGQPTIDMLGLTLEGLDLMQQKSI